MANLLLTPTAKFTPFSFAERIKPDVLLNEQFDALQEAYSDLSAQASVWENRANQATESKAYNQYKKFADDLRIQADRLVKEGLNASSRQAMLNMKSRYASEITPINEAYTKREEWLKEQRKNPNMRYSVDASTLSLDDMLFDLEGKPRVTSYESVDLNDVFQKSSAAFAPLSKVLNSYSVTGKLDDYNKKVLKDYGISQSDLNDFINASRTGNFNSSNPVVKLMDNIGQSVYGNTRVGGWNNKKVEREIWNTINMAASQALGRDEVSSIADQKKIYELTHPNRTGTGNEDKSDFYSKHWSGSIDADQNAGRTNNLIKSISEDLKNENSMYFGKDKKLNPMKLYDEALQYAKDHKVIRPLSISEKALPHNAGRNFEDGSWSNAVKVIEDKYGVRLIGSSDYQALKNLGYTSQSSTNDFSETTLREREKEKSQIYRASSINLSDYDKLASDIGNVLRMEDQSFEGKLYRRTSSGRKGEAVEVSDIFSDDKDALFDVAYSIASPTDIAIRTRKGEFFIDPSIYDQKLANLLIQFTSDLDKLNSKQKAERQEQIAEFIKNTVNSYNRIRSNTSSTI